MLMADSTNKCLINKQIFKNVNHVTMSILSNCRAVLFELYIPKKMLKNFIVYFKKMIVWNVCLSIGRIIEIFDVIITLNIFAIDNVCIEKSSFVQPISFIQSVLYFAIM